MDTKNRRKRTRKPHSTKPADFAEAAAAANKPPADPQIVMMETEFHHYYYSLVESIPVPKLTWSTTAPAVLCPAPPEDALLEFEWAAENEGQAWWVGFLKSLDCKSGNGAQENTMAAVESCKEAPAPAPAMDPSGTFPEDWLCFPAAEDHGDQPAA